MGKDSLTKDEKLILALYQKTQELEDEDTYIDSHEVGQSIGMPPKQVDAICAQLMRANFIKRQDKHFVILTQQGIRLAEDLGD
jgi:Mn-dependent DtxR family transcriptional regulator